MCVSGASVSYLARIFCLWWAGYVSFTHMMLYRLSIATLSLNACLNLVLVG